MKRRVVWMLGLLVAGACGDTGPSGLQYLALLAGGNEVPPLITQSGGTASFTVSGGQIAYAITLQNITGVTDAGIYLGAAGVVGPKVADLYSGATTGPIASGSLVTGTVSASGLTALSLDSLQVLMNNGTAYVNIITVTLPNGEVRGQIHQN